MKYAARETLHRIDQGLRALRPIRIPGDRDQVIAEILTPGQADAFRQLPPFDQVHLLNVCGRLRRQDAGRDLLAAGLLHDLGKTSAHGHVRIVDRVIRVLLHRSAPQFLARLAGTPDRRLLHGLHLCVHHARLGAERARCLGCSERTVWLIAHHEDRDPGDDADLIALQSADRG